MKSLIVYYSLTGNIDYVANIIKEKNNADVIRLIPKKEYPNSGFKKFFWGGKSAIMKEKPELEEYTFDAEKYDRIIIGMPVWASNMVPPIRTFVEDNKEEIKNKKISVVVSYSGGGAEKVIEDLKNCLGIDEFEAKLILIDPKDKNTEEKEKQISDFCEAINN